MLVAGGQNSKLRSAVVTHVSCYFDLTLVSIMSHVTSLTYGMLKWSSETQQHTYILSLMRTTFSLEFYQGGFIQEWRLEQRARGV